MKKMTTRILAVAMLAILLSVSFATMAQACAGNSSCTYWSSTPSGYINKGKCGAHAAYLDCIVLQCPRCNVVFHSFANGR